jgi:hypothetical protein
LAFCTGERMPAERTTMRQVREVLRLRTAGVGLNEIAPRRASHLDRRAARRVRT